MAPQLTAWERVRCRVRGWLRVTYHLTWGLMLCVMAAVPLQPWLFRGAPLHDLVPGVVRWATLLCLILLPLQLWDGTRDDVREWRPWDRRKWWFVLFGTGGVLCAWQSSQVWAAPGAAACFFALLWLRVAHGRHRFPIALAGWIWAGMLPLTVAWPNEQRFELALLTGGVFTVFQGIVEMVRYGVS